MSLYNDRFLQGEHPNTRYFKNDEIGLTLSRALAETYKAQPGKPIEFFAKFLLNHSRTQKKAQAEKEREKVVKDLKDKHTYFIKAKHAEVFNQYLINIQLEEIAKEDKEKQRKVKAFYDMLEKSEDLTDNLDELAVFLKEFTNSTGVYIGKLVKPRKEINEDDDDKAHIDDENPKVINFIHASDAQHEFMRGKILKPTEGVTHRVFNPPQKAQPDDDEELSAEEQQLRAQAAALAEQDVLQTHHVYIQEVVREPKMHFYKVPKLGAFLAIPLCYKSCLFEDALDNAVADYFAVQKAREEQEKQRQDWEEEQQKFREEKERLGESYESNHGEQPTKEWPIIQERPFDTEDEQYVVCLDTMGQDREFSEDERRLAISTVINFKEIWERTEQENLTRDRNRKIEIMEIDKEFLDNESAKIMEEEDKHVEEMINQYNLEGNVPVDDEVKELINKQSRLHFIAQLFRERSDWKKNLLTLRSFKVLKYQRVMQSLFYFLLYSREDICEKNTNKFFWKRAKMLLNDDFLDRLVDYTALGPKEDYRPRYTTLNFIERNLDNISPDEVDSYHLTLGKLYRWLLLAIKTRKEDIVRRKALKKRAREQREDLIEQAKKREDKYQQDFKDAQQKFIDEHKEEIDNFNRVQLDIQEKGQAVVEEEYQAEGKGELPVLPVFNESDWQAQWLSENPEIAIPDPVVEEKDQDWYMNQEEEDMYISQYFQAKEGSFSQQQQPPPAGK